MSRAPCLLPDQGTIHAYENTDYLADDQPVVRLRIGDAPQQHQQWLARHHACSASILTAWNPFGQALTHTENDALQSRLQTTILHSGLGWLPARGEDPDGQWQPEPGFCLFDLPLPLLNDWLRLFRQNAAVRVTQDSACHLVWHPDIVTRWQADKT
ncbi:MAG: DUF3293 domain-containing protein [Lautropia sp.]|nr:DUF3293 domain-containing protein [Lautropia sp.]